MKLKEVVDHNPKWFTKEIGFFQDRSYELQLGMSGKAYLIREMAEWSGMLDGEMKWHFRINPVSEEYKILPLVTEVLKDLDEVDAWLADH